MSYKKFDKKLVKAPRGSSPILPPISIMSALSPMGNIPGTNDVGYVIGSKLYTDDYYDYY